MKIGFTEIWKNVRRMAQNRKRWKALVNALKKKLSRSTKREGISRLPEQTIAFLEGRAAWSYSEPTRELVTLRAPQFQNSFRIGKDQKVSSTKIDEEEWQITTQNAKRQA